MVKVKRIITDSIKDHLIPHVFSLKNNKDMFDSLKKIYEGKNINKNMTLRTQLKGVKMETKFKKHTSLIPKGITDQGTTRIYWRQCLRIKSGDDYLEWSLKFMGIFHSRNFCEEKDHQIQYARGGIHTRRSSIGNKRRKYRRWWQSIPNKSF